MAVDHRAFFESETGILIRIHCPDRKTFLSRIKRVMISADIAERRHIDRAGIGDKCTGNLCEIPDFNIAFRRDGTRHMDVADSYLAGSGRNIAGIYLIFPIHGDITVDGEIFFRHDACRKNIALRMQSAAFRVSRVSSVCDDRTGIMLRIADTSNHDRTAGFHISAGKITGRINRCTGRDDIIASKFRGHCTDQEIAVIGPDGFCRDISGANGFVCNDFTRGIDFSTDKIPCGRVMFHRFSVYSDIQFTVHRTDCASLRDFRCSDVSSRLNGSIFGDSHLADCHGIIRNQRLCVDHGIFTGHDIVVGMHLAVYGCNALCCRDIPGINCKTVFIGSIGGKALRRDRADDINIIIRMNRSLRSVNPAADKNGAFGID